jgi:hypothetical protein
MGTVPLLKQFYAIGLKEQEVIDLMRWDETFKL